MVFHFLSYPGVFSETGLLGAGPQTTAWLYIAWHGGFPLFVIAYALLRERDAMAGERPPARLALSVGLAVTLAAALVTLASTAGHDALPALMSDNRYTPSAIFFLGGAWVVSMLALVMLWWRSVRSLLDVWVVVVMFAWVFDIGLSAVLNGGRYDLGFYAGRLYGLFAASIVMSVILFETSGLYSRLAATADRLRRQVRETETRQELVEAQLRQAQKMEAIGNLTGGMAHDFNNLLAVIIGNLDLLLEKRPFDPDIKELGGEALDAGLRGADLTRRLLAFARRQPLQPKEVQLNDLIAGITRLLSRTLGENVEVSLDLDPKLWPVIVDPAQLDACLANLATNARDAMPSGGSLVIVTANRHLDEDYAAEHVELAAGDYAMIEVTDTGSGMAPETTAHIFEPFFTTKELGRGTGLGLSMVYGFMKQSGGHINVYSEPGIGTTFRLYLPRAPHVAAGVVPSPATDTLQGRGETILTVEDNASLRRVVVRQLRELGYKVLEAEHAAAAMQVLEQEKVDLLFTDVVMAGMSGLELAAVVRERWPGMRIVITSGFPEAHVGGNGNATPTATAGTPPLSPPTARAWRRRRASSTSPTARKISPASSARNSKAAEIRGRLCPGGGTGESSQEKHTPDHDLGWKPVFRPTLRKFRESRA